MWTALKAVTAAIITAQSCSAIVPSGQHADFSYNKAKTAPAPAAASSAQAYNFSVPVDHFHDDPQYEPHSDGMFDMRYFLETSFYKPGGPVIVIASGETSAENRVPYLSNGIGSLLAKATNGLVLTLEHRYYGSSFPVPDLNDGNYRFLTTEQAVADTAYFAQHVQFPGFENVELTAPKTPWIIYGGSYAGAFAAFTRKLYPDAFWGAISSSGVTEAVYDYWAYNEAARLYTPGDCGPVMANATKVVDTALFSQDSSKASTIKQLFRVSDSTSNADFGSTISPPSYAMQSESWVKGESDDTMQRYCKTITADTLQYSDLESSRATAETLVQDAGLPTAFATQMLNYVGLQTEGNGRRRAEEQKKLQMKRSGQLYDGESWHYQTCTQWGYYVTGSGVPQDIQGIISRAVTLDSAISGCQSSFGITTPPNVDSINKLGGTNFSYPRVAIIDGKQDPWRAATPHKEGANAGRQSTTEEPFLLIDYATHHWDEDDIPASQYKPGYPPKQIVDVHNQEVAFVKAWLDEFHKQRK